MSGMSRTRRNSTRQPCARVLVLLLLTALLLPGTIHAADQDIADEIFYHFMPICWRDSDSDIYRFGDFGGMTASLDYLETLGVTAIWMNPIFPAAAYHGYQHGAADQLNPWFGDEGGLSAFLEAAHARDIKVFVDFVAYGISHNSIWFQDAYGNPASSYDDWLAFENSANTDYLGSVYTTWNGDSVGFIHWDLRNSGPVNLLTEWARHWLDPDDDGDFSDGLDGYRLDHVWQIYPNGPDGWGYHIDSFWAPWREALRAVNPEVIVFAEQADWGSYGTELFPGMDAVFTKPLEFAARDALIYETAGSLYSQMEATLAALAGADEPGQFLCTISNHDVSRLASVIGDSFAKGKAAAAVLLTQPFTPIIYFGDEIGMRGTKNTDYTGDAADIPMREPFKWNAVAGAPMTNYFVLNSDAYNGRISADYDGRSVEEQLNVPGSLLEAWRELIGARRDNIAMRRGEYSAVPASAGAIWAFIRAHADQQVLVMINLSSGALSCDLDLGDFTIAGGSTTPTDLLGGASLSPLTDANCGAYAVSLPACGYGLYEVQVAAPEPPQSLVDGRDIPTDFGAASPAATQNNATGLGDNQAELNQLFVRREADRLYLGLTGNLPTDGTGLSLFLDTKTGGRQQLDMNGFWPPPSGPQNFTNLLFDAGFEPDWLYYINAWAGTIYVDCFALQTGGGIIKEYRGAGTVGDGDGLLSGGTNPNGLQVALDNTNILGVTATDASGAATAVTGFELAIPLDDLGLAGTGEVQIGLAAFLNENTGDVSNQWLPGLGGGWSNPGLAPDMTLIPGDQFVTIVLDDLSAVGDSGTDPQTRLDLGGVVFPNPVTGRGSFSFSLPREQMVSVAVYDLAGRLVRRIHEGSLPAGPNTLNWNGRDTTGRAVSAGTYLYHLRGEGIQTTGRVLIVR